MPSTMQDQAFGKPSFCPSFAKPLGQGSKIAGLGVLGTKYPSFAPDATSHQENIFDPISHRDGPSSVGGLAVRDKNHPVVPIYVFNARTVELLNCTNVPESALRMELGPIVWRNMCELT